MVNIPHNYHTSDTALAAYLISQGFELLDMDNSNPNSVVFYFNNSSTKLNKIISQWELGTAKGNVVNFYSAYKRLVQRIKVVNK